MQVLYKHKELGEVLVTFKPNARRFIARWGEYRVNMTAPYKASHNDVLKAIDDLAPRLLSAPKTEPLRYRENQVITLDGLNITIVSNPLEPDLFFVQQHETDKACILVGKNVDYSQPSTTATISKALKTIAKKNAVRLLLPRAKEIAAQLGCHPSGWQISSGSRILGQCSGTGIIKLSYMNVFLNSGLRDYIICHELAHLSEFNHSPRFHKLCDSYLGGKEKERIAELKSYRWPLIRK